KGPRLTSGLHFLDRMIIGWGFWYIASSAFHNDDSTITRLGEIYTDVGIYFLCRAFIRSYEDIYRVFEIVSWLFLPVALGMLMERFTGNNIFAMAFGDSASTDYRNGHYRAHGPFAHAISAGTIGSVCLPMAICLWRRNRKAALLGLMGTATVIFSSGSSGPFM